MERNLRPAQAPETSDLYFECHLTVEPLAGEKLGIFKMAAEDYGFRVADLLMKKPGGEWAPSSIDTFATGRDKDYERLYGRMVDLMTSCTFNDIAIWRYKIENTVLDVRVARD